jgi:hypothetical protein
LISAYAKRHGLSAKSLYYWQHKLKTAAPPSAHSRPTGKFIALRVIDAANAPQANHCTLVLPAGLRLEMSALPTPEWLLALGRAAQGTR